jgi:hypothetical protein
MQIQVNVNNLTLIQNDELNENEYNIHSIQFVFSNEYEGNLAKVALFTANDKSYKMILQDDKCSIPPEVLVNQGCFTLGVYAFEVDGENLIERFSPSPIQLYIQTGSYISDDNIENSEPLTATDKEQILAQLAQIEVDIQQIEVNTQDISNIKAEQTTQNTNIQNNANEIERVERLIPTKTSELQNDSGFIDNSVNNLINYTLTTQTGSKIDLEINSSTYELTAKLYDKNNNLISTSTTIDLPLESMVLNIEYDNTTKELVITLQNGTVRRIPLSDIIDGLVSQTDFDALELRVDTAETDIETLQGQVETLETQVSELEEQVSELEANQLTGEAEGTSIDINDSADAKVRSIGLVGRTTQESTTGKNLLPVESTISFTRFKRIEVSLPAGTYIITNEGRNTTANTSAISVNDQIKGGFTSTSKSVTFTSSTDITSIGLYASSDYASSSGITCGYSNLMLRSSTITDDTYEPYTGGEAAPSPSYPFEIKNTGDNGTINERIRKKDFFDESALTIDKWLFESGNEVNREGAIITDFINVSSSNDYILTNTYRYNVTNNVTVCQYDKNRNWITGTTYSIPEYTNFNLPISDLNSNCEYIRISIYDFTHTSNNQFAEPISFPLAEGQKLMEGDYLADDGVHHKMGEYVITGNESGWEIFNTDKCARIVKNDVAGVTTSEIGNIYCNQLKKTTQNNIQGGNVDYGISTRTNTTKGICIRNKNCITLTDYIDWFKSLYDANKPIIVQYPLAEEVIDSYTEEQQTAWEQIKNLKTYKPVTHISSEDETPANVDVVYVRDLETVINNLS